MYTNVLITLILVVCLAWFMVEQWRQWQYTKSSKPHSCAMPDELASIWNALRESFAKGLYGECLHLADQAIADEPANVMYLEFKALSLFRLGRVEEARIVFELLMESPGTSFEKWKRLYDKAAQQGSEPAAES